MRDAAEREGVRASACTRRRRRRDERRARVRSSAGTPRAARAADEHEARDEPRFEAARLYSNFIANVARARGENEAEGARHRPGLPRPRSPNAGWPIGVKARRRRAGALPRIGSDNGGASARRVGGDGGDEYGGRRARAREDLLRPRCAALILGRRAALDNPTATPTVSGVGLADVGRPRSRSVSMPVGARDFMPQEVLELRRRDDARQPPT